jgi:hypothetical protein
MSFAQSVCFYRTREIGECRSLVLRMTINRFHPTDRCVTPAAVMFERPFP